MGIPLLKCVTLMTVINLMAVAPLYVFIAVFLFCHTFGINIIYWFLFIQKAVIIIHKCRIFKEVNRMCLLIEASFCEV